MVKIVNTSQNSQVTQGAKSVAKGIYNALGAAVSMTGYLTGATRGSERPEDECLQSARGLNSSGNNLYQDNYQKI